MLWHLVNSALLVSATFSPHTEGDKNKQLSASGEFDE